MLQGAGEFIVESVDEGNDTSRNLENLAGDWYGLPLVIIPFLGILDYDVIRVGLKNLQ